MPDYGHDLRLGAFLTPQSRRPQDVVALAQLSAQSGLDLVTFQATRTSPRSSTRGRSSRMSPLRPIASSSRRTF
jgi:hypothetical protein